MLIKKVTDYYWMIKDIIDDPNPSKSEIWIKNMRAERTNSKFNPSHYLTLWVDDPGVAAFMANELHLNVKDVDFEDRDENGDVIGKRVRKCVTVKTYPKLKLDKRTGKRVPVPEVTFHYPTAGDTVPVDIDHLERIDETQFKTIDIVFYLWEYEPGKNVVCITELCGFVDEDAPPSVPTGSVLRKMYGFNMPKDDDDDRPF